ncbi:DUF421 domain-containing protein [Bifidobacterium aemilianum]|uniref:DUF421 domain-containing protein n=1 Tax=Bifidobacterium aemilianum TaxID=2493120 RepID=UPI00191BFB6D|nr:DUF421 domain-containing protein [Bifidobacterium aemilianum]
MVYSTLFIKLAVGILFLVVQINIMGKTNLAPISVMDQVQNYVLGGIIGGVIYNKDISVLDFIVVMLIWTLLVLVLKVAKEQFSSVKKLVDGKPLTLIFRGKVDVALCMRSGISASDLMLKLRSQGIYETSSIKKAVLEQSGQLTVVSYEDENLKLPVITDGQVDEAVLETIGHDEDWLDQQVKDKGFKGTNDVFLAQYDDQKLSLIGYAGRHR